MGSGLAWFGRAKIDKPEMSDAEAISAKFNSAPNCNCDWIDQADACSNSGGECYLPCKRANPGNFCRTTSSCLDIDYGKGDSSGDHCSKYYSHTSWCRKYDTHDFASGGMCCACGGGKK